MQESYAGVRTHNGRSEPTRIERLFWKVVSVQCPQPQFLGSRRRPNGSSKLLQSPCAITKCPAASDTVRFDTSGIRAPSPPPLRGHHLPSCRPLRVLSGPGSPPSRPGPGASPYSSRRNGRPHTRRASCRPSHSRNGSLHEPDRAFGATASRQSMQLYPRSSSYLNATRWVCAVSSTTC